MFLQGPDYHDFARMQFQEPELNTPSSSSSFSSSVGGGCCDKGGVQVHSGPAPQTGSTHSEEQAASDAGSESLCAASLMWIQE